VNHRSILDKLWPGAKALQASILRSFVGCWGEDLGGVFRASLSASELLEALYPSNLPPNKRANSFSILLGLLALDKHQLGRPKLLPPMGELC